MSKVQSAMSAQIASMAYADLLARKEEIGDRLAVIGVNDGRGSKRKGGSKKRAKPISIKSSEETPTNNAHLNAVPYETKTDTHWDFVMKEMMWLAADFQAERKRQLSLGKKVSTAMRQFHKTKESRRLRELAEAEVKRRRLAGKIGRDVKGWWAKIERVIAYKQRLDADAARQNAMDKQLVELVKQTERYGESLALHHGDRTEDDSDESGEESKHRSRRRRKRLTIEEALAAANKPTRRAKNMFTDYSRVHEKLGYDNFYGESTASDTGSDNTFMVDSVDDDTDDETTLLEEEAREAMERKRREARRGILRSGNDHSFVSDAEELHKLREESEMDINDVIRRLVEEGNQQKDDDSEGTEETDDIVTEKSVTFAPTAEEANKGTLHNAGRRTQHINGPRKDSGDPGNDADDDADASDVEDFLIDQSSGDVSDGSDEFEADEHLVDDETTIEEEEKLGRTISADEEIRLLKKENEMSIEELRKLYGAIDGQDEANEAENSTSQVEGNDLLQQASDAQNSSPYTQLLDTDDAGDEDEFRPSTMEIDDETTIEAEERLGRDMSHEEEINMLQNESEIPIEELRKMYENINGMGQEESDDSSIPPSDVSSQHDTDAALGAIFVNAVGDDTEGDEFRPDDSVAVDDETTIEAEERLGRDMSYEEELAMLQRENEMSVEELRRMYLGGADSNESDSNVSREAESHTAMSAMFEDDDNRDEDEFHPDVGIVDDERTLVEEEKLGREMSPEDEIALLKQESETPIEALREMYQSLEGGDQSDEEKVSSKRKRKPEAEDLSSRKRPSVSTGSEEDSDEGMTALQTLQLLEERARKTTASRPFLLSSWVKLREYQQIGLNWLVSIQTRRLNGILADEMGLGKTLQTIALLSYLAAYKGIWGPHLVIVPTSCIVNWETEFKRFCPAMKVLCYYGSAKRRKELRTGWTKANWHHVIVTSYQLVVQDSFAFKRKKWYYMILDEAQNIKNFQSQRWQTLINFNSQRRLLLTGTPLQNNLMELWSLMHFLMPHVFRSRKEFSYWFSNPMNSIIEGNSNRNDQLIGRLHGIIRPFVLRRLKKDVEKQMPGKYEHIVKCKLSRRQMFLYEEFMARSSTRQSLKKGGNFMGMMNVLMQLRKVCNHPDLFEPRSVITPFVTERISVDTASCVVGVGRPPSVLESVSRQLFHPLWCGGCGIPSLAASSEFGTTKANQLRTLEATSQTILDSVSDSDIDEPLPEENTSPSLSLLLTTIWKEARTRKEANFGFQARVNSWRCRSAAFPFNNSLLDRVTLVDRPLDRDNAELFSGASVISTPSQLLAMRRSQQERSKDLDDTIKKFVFCVPKAGALRPRLNSRNLDVPGGEAETRLSSMLLQPVEELFQPFRKAHARLSSFFPDKKLVQFDAGKLQTLSELLRELKHGGHRVLIFTQMSKMLDILEAFLNLNGHTYLRLDGGTGVDRRQRLMDRFNNDDKVFCFILSTRSGGLGINLTGADTVIFYDSDWNPAMDAQAQDRAHRIGQTRDVHIYRLITEHSIEENILIKAQQKRNLDIMVMDEGKFDASQLQRSVDNIAGDGKTDDSTELFSKGGLRDILGVGTTEDEGKSSNEMKDDDELDGGGESSGHLSKEQMENAMASLEDEDDVLAMRGAQKEAADELQEFDESIELKKDESGVDSQEDGADDGDGVDTDSKKTKKGAVDQQKDEKKESTAAEEEMEREFAAWQTKVGMDPSAIEASLTSSERYGIRFREDIDPFWSVFAINEYRRKMEATETEEIIHPDEIERAKAEDERRAMDEGDLLGTRPEPEELPRHRNLYLREKARLRSNKKRRKLNGENWAKKIDGLTKNPFWYNVDTGEALWDKPKVLVELEADEMAHKKLWAALPIKPLVHVMGFLLPFPDRTRCSSVCRQWRAAAGDFSFIRHVLPVEMGALGVDDRNLEHNHYRTIVDALSIALPGDTIELGDGHYWVNEPGITIDFPLKIVGDEHDPSHVVIELGGSVKWRGSAGWIEGVTFRRPQISGEISALEVLRVEDGGKIDMIHCVINNGGSKGDAIVVHGPGPNGRWKDVEVTGSVGQGCGIVVDSEGQVELLECTIASNGGTGLLCKQKASFKLRESKINNNGGVGVALRGESRGELIRCQFAHNAGGVMEREFGSSCVPCSGNTCIASATCKQRPLPGVRCVDEAIGPKDPKNEEIEEDTPDLVAST